jgi:hypothetical protein
MFRKRKKYEIEKYDFTTHSSTFGSNMLLASKLIFFEDLVVTKVIIFM